MGIFRQFPYSNFHEMNMDWLLKNWKKLSEEWEKYKTTIDTEINELDAFKEFFEAWIGDNISDSVFEWLESHPDAVTMNWFVTPQMYGAKADGVTDDLTAFNAAIASGKQVIIPEGSYYLSETIFSDDSIIYKDSGTYVDKTVLISKVVSETTPIVGAYPDMNLAAMGMKGIQSATFNTKKRRVVLGAHLSYAHDLPIIVEIEPWNPTVFNQVESPALGHVSDMTYNSRTDMIYVVSGNINEIIPVNADNLAVSSPIYTDIGEALDELSYDEINNIYFARTQSGLYVLDNEFRKIKRLWASVPEIDNYPYRDIQGAWFQGSTFYHSQFISCYWLWGTAGSTSFARLAQYNYADASIKRMYDVAEILSDCEPEALLTIDDDLYILSYINESLAIRRVVPNATEMPTLNSIGYSIINTGNPEGASILGISLLCNENTAHLEFEVRAEGTWPAGLSQSFNINIAGLTGIAMGWSAGSLIMAYVNNNTVEMRVFGDDFPDQWSALIRGNLVRM